MQNKFFKSIVFLGILSIVFMGSCKKKIEDAYLNPNAATKEPVESILSGVIGSFTAFFSSAGTGYGLQADGILLGRYVQYWGTQTNGENYGQMGGVLPPSDALGGLWAAVYYGQGQNLNKIVQYGIEQEKWDYVGVATAIRAWGWLELTNMYGDAILKEAFNTSLSQFHYDTQPEFYDSCRAVCFRSLNFLNRTGGNVSQANLAIGDAFFYKGDVNKWKKFVYGILARSYINLSNKAIFTTNGYADSVIKYANLAMKINDDNAVVKVAGGSTSAVNNFYGPFRGNIGTIRQGAYIADLMSGRLDSAFKNVSDPRAWYILRENYNRTFKGFTPWLGTSGLSANEYPKNFWGNATADITGAPSSTGPSTPDSSRYLYQNTSPWPIMTASEMQFDIAEAYLRKGAAFKPQALTAYFNGISLNFDMLTTTYSQNIPAANVITQGVKDAYLADPSVVPAASNLTLTHVMLQKYIALYAWGTLLTWTDLRKFHYTDLDPTNSITQKVYTGFFPPSGINLITTNNSKLVYRSRPRYNSEYLYDIPELTRIGALNLDYNTQEEWFSQK